MGEDQEDDGFERIRQQYPPIITTAQVAELLDINPRTVLMMASDGRLPASRLPGSRKFHFFLDDVLGTLRQNMVTPGTAGAVVELEAEDEEVVEAPPVRKKRASARGSTRS
jgi:excisionase family DNA binding protein